MTPKRERVSCHFDVQRFRFGLIGVWLVGASAELPSKTARQEPRRVQERRNAACYE